MYMIVTEPGLTPVTMPLEEPTVAIDVLPLLQVPPGVVELNVMLRPIQTDPGPVIAAGSGFTVIVVVV